MHLPTLRCGTIRRQRHDFQTFPGLTLLEHHANSPQAPRSSSRLCAPFRRHPATDDVRLHWGARLAERRLALTTAIEHRCVLHTQVTALPGARTDRGSAQASNFLTDQSSCLLIHLEPLLTG